jgi:hypothetical protein
MQLASSRFNSAPLFQRKKFCKPAPTKVLASPTPRLITKAAMWVRLEIVCFMPTLIVNSHTLTSFSSLNGLRLDNPSSVRQLWPGSQKSLWTCAP